MVVLPGRPHTARHDLKNNLPRRFDLDQSIVEYGLQTQSLRNRLRGLSSATNGTHVKKLKLGFRLQGPRHSFGLLSTQFRESCLRPVDALSIGSSLAVTHEKQSHPLGLF